MVHGSLQVKPRAVAIEDPAIAPQHDDDPCEPLRAPGVDDDLLEAEEDVGRRNKRRKGRRSLKPPVPNGRAKKKGTVRGKDADKVRLKEKHETFNINEGEDDDCSEDDDLGPAPQMPHQLKYYKGNERALLDRSRLNFHIYLLKVNGFPNAEDITTWAQLAYKHAGMFLYRDKYEGEYPISMIVWTLTRV